MQREFVEAFVEQARARGVLVIFDEVISGFRCSPGGAQSIFGIKPDLTTLAKILAGGHPGGALAGRRDILAALDFVHAEETGRERISHHGTFNANPISAAAGVATLELVANGEVCRRANEYAARLREAMSRELHDKKVPWIVYGTFSGFHIFTNPERLNITTSDIESGLVDYRAIKAPATRLLSTKLRLGMLIHGVEIFSWPGGPTSAMHDEDDLARTVEAFSRTLRLLCEEGSV